MIVVTAPTADIGGRVLDHVLAPGATDQPVRVVVRDPAKLSQAVRDRVEVVEGSHRDADVVARAFGGADALFWLCPGDPRATDEYAAYVDFSAAAVQALRGGSIRRVVDITALGRGTDQAGRAGHVSGSLAMDDQLAATGVGLRMLANPSFMDNLLRQAQVIKTQGAYFDIVSPGSKRPTVATRDIAALAARWLLDDTWSDQQTVPVLGPEDLSNDDQAAIMTDALGFPVRYQQIPGDALTTRLAAAGMSEGMARSFLDMMIAKEHGLDNGVARSPQDGIDTPTTFRQWCTDTLTPAVAAA